MEKQKVEFWWKCNCNIHPNAIRTPICPDCKGQYYWVAVHPKEDYEEMAEIYEMWKDSSKCAEKIDKLEKENKLLKGPVVKQVSVAAMAGMVKELLKDPEKLEELFQYKNKANSLDDIGIRLQELKRPKSIGMEAGMNAVCEFITFVESAIKRLEAK